MSQVPAARRRKTKADAATPAVTSAVAETPRAAESSTDAQKRTKAGTKRKRGKNDDDEEAPKPKLPRRSKVVNCEACRFRKSKCDHGRPGCSQCKLTGVECVYSKDAQPIPGLLSFLGQGGELAFLARVLPDIVGRLKGACGDLEGVMAISNSTAQPETKDLNKMLTMSFTLNKDGFFAGPSALASYPSVLDTPASGSTTLASDASLSVFGGAPLSVFNVPQIPIDESFHILLDQQRLRNTVNWYKDHVVQEFRFATPEVLERLCRDDPQSPLLLYACAVGFLHTSNASDALHVAPMYFQLAQELSQRREAFGVKANIDTLEAQLLQAQYLVTTRGDAEKVWRIAGDSVRLAVSLGLHREARQVVRDGGVANRRRWAMHNSLFLDRWTSFISGRPSSLRNREFNTALPDNEGGRFATHGEIFKFVRILGDVMEETSSVFTMSCERGEALETRLSTFLAGASSAGSNDPGRLNIINLRLMVHHCRVMMHMPRIHLDDECEALHQEGQDSDVDFAELSFEAAKAVIIEAGNIPARIAGRLAWAPHIIEAAAQRLIAHSSQEGKELLPNAAHALSWFEDAPIASNEQKTVDRLLRLGAGNAGPVAAPSPPPLPIAGMSFDGLLSFDTGVEDSMPFFAGGPFVGANDFFRLPEPMPESVDPSLLLARATQ